MNVRERLRGAARGIGYGVFFVVVLFVFVAWTFPYDSLRQKLIGAFNAQQRPGSSQQQLEIDALDGYWVTGVEAEGVRLLSPSSEPGGSPAVTSIDAASARLRLLPLLIFRKVIAFDLDLQGGRVDGKVSQRGDDRSIELHFDGVDVAEIGPVKQALGLPMQGLLYGTITLELPGGKASKANGRIALELEDLALGDGKAKVKIPGLPGEGLTVQKLQVGTLSLAGEVTDGVFKLEKMSSKGPDLIVEGEGKITLKDLAMESIADITLGLSISDAYKNKSDANKGLFAMLDFAPEAKAAKRADGSFGLRLSGSLSRLKPVPAGGANRSGLSPMRQTAPLGAIKP